MDFEFNPSKSEANRTKHGISFEEARELWAVFGIERIVTSDPEVRWIRVGLWREKFYTAVYTLRDERVRIISTRRSRKDEIKLYQLRMNNEKETEKDFN